MIVLGLDPGTEQTAVVIWDGARVTYHFHGPNDDVLDWLVASRGPGAVLVIEKIESYGMAVGESTFATVFWSGRFAQAWCPRRFEQMGRRIVKQHLCHSARATDSNIRQAILDRFGGEKAIGVKKAQGPLYGMKGHEFAAFAVALTFWDRHQSDGEQLRPGTTAMF